MYREDFGFVSGDPSKNPDDTLKLTPTVAQCLVIAVAKQGNLMFHRIGIVGKDVTDKDVKSGFEQIFAGNIFERMAEDYYVYENNNSKQSIKHEMEQKHLSNKNNCDQTEKWLFSKRFRILSKFSKCYEQAPKKVK